MITEKECRICLENDKIDEFIHPCLCDGTSKWVHSSCINKWRQLNISRKGYYQCMECNYKYKFSRELILESYKFKSSEIVYILSGFISYVLSFIFGYGLYLFDVENNMLSIKAVTFNDKEFINSTKMLFEKEYYFSVYYSDLLMCILYNVCQILFFHITLCNVNRKLLYLNLFKKQIIYNMFVFNNFFYVYYFLCVMGMKELYFITSPFINVYSIKLFFYLCKKHNKIVRLMNTKYNNQQLLNYVDNTELYEENDELVESDETKVALLEGKSESQNFDNIELNS